MNNLYVDMLASSLGSESPTMFYMQFYKGKSLIDLCKIKNSEIDLFKMWEFYNSNIDDKYKEKSFVKFCAMAVMTCEFEFLDGNIIKLKDDKKVEL